MKDFETIVEMLDYAPQDYKLHRKYEHFGWQIVGWTNAKNEGRLYFATLSGSCRGGHAAPYLVNGRVCAKCFIVAKRRNIMLQRETTEMTKTQIRDFWRKQLNLPHPADDCKKPNYIYIVDSFPYTNIKEAAKITGIKVNVIRYRCESDEYVDFVSIPTSLKL